jgi:hypothetical protein
LTMANSRESSRAGSEDLKAWTHVRALGCRAGIVVVRTDPLDGPRMYFSIRLGVPRQHADLPALVAYVNEIAQGRA